MNGAAEPVAGDATGTTSPSLSSSSVDAILEPTPAPLVRARARLLVLVLALGAWFMPWLDEQRGPSQSGAPAALALAAAWGLAATALVATRRRALLVGEALTSAGLAALMTALVALRHPWLPGPDRTATCLPIFGPLAALGVLDAVTRLRRPPLAGEVAAIRATAALLCAGALFVAMDPLPAIVALWLAIAPAAVVLPRTARGARRALEALSLFAAVAVFLGPDAHERLVALREQPGVATAWPLVFALLGAALAILSGRGVLLPESTTHDAPR